MKYQTKDTGYREAVIQDFGGLDRAAALCGGSTAFDVRNFRRMKDGSLKRRGGLVPLATFEEDIRGAISILRNGAYETYAVAGQTVYTIEEKDGAFSVAPIAAIASTEGEVTFLEYGGHLILLDGDQFLSLSPDGAMPTDGTALRRRIVRCMRGRICCPAVCGSRFVCTRTGITFTCLRCIPFRWTP